MRAGRVLDATRGPLLQGIRKARSEVLLAAPFISAEVAEDVARAALASGVKTRRLLTALNENAVRTGFLSPSGLLTLADAGFEVRSIRNLHAKVVLADGVFGLVGSGNLTSQGLGGQQRKNLELGVALTKSQVVAAEETVNRWWKQGEPVSRATLDKYVAMAPARGKGQRWGGGYGPFVYGDDPDPAPQRRSGSTGLWLKMLYHHTRRDQPNWWRKVTWISDGRPPPSPQNLVNGPRYEIDDLLVFYLVEVGGPIRRCAAVAEVKSHPRHDPDFVGKNGFPGDEEQWPWVTKVKVIDSTSLELAPTLDDIGVDPRSTERKGRLVLQPRQFASARDAISANP
jgi:hypothetical protein